MPDQDIEATAADLAESRRDTDVSGPAEGGHNAEDLAPDLGEDDVEELEFLIDDIEDQIAPLAL
jgi:hypothetical protein